MRIPFSPFAVLLFSIFILSACSNGDSVEIVWRSSKMEVISTRYHYGTESGRQYWRRLSLKVNGSEIQDREISEKLFPKTSPCFSPFYGVSDVRPLKDEAVLALLSIHESTCGEAQLVRLSVERGKLRVQHIELSPFSKGRSGAEAASFEDVHPRVSAPDTPYLDVQLAAQRDMQTEWVAVQVREETADNQFVQKRTIAIRLADLSLHDLGPGELLRFVDDNSVALMTDDAERRTAQAHVQYRAVRPIDSAVLDRVDLHLACFALTDPEKQDRLLSDLDRARDAASARVEMLERTIKDSEAIATTDPKFPGVIDSLKEDVATTARELAELNAVSKSQLVSGKGLGNSTRWIHASAVSRALLDAEQTSVEWNAGQGKLELKLSPGLTRDTHCEEQHSDASDFLRLLAQA